MGRYVQAPVHHGKAEYIAKQGNGEILTDPPASFADIPEGKALIVVCDNGFFEAAGYAYSAEEFKAFTLPKDKDPRPKKFVLVDKDYAESNAV